MHTVHTRMHRWADKRHYLGKRVVGWSSTSDGCMVMHLFSPAPAACAQPPTPTTQPYAASTQLPAPPPAVVAQTPSARPASSTHSHAADGPAESQGPQPLPPPPLPLPDVSPLPPPQLLQLLAVKREQLEDGEEGSGPALMVLQPPLGEGWRPQEQLHTGRQQEGAGPAHMCPMQQQQQEEGPISSHPPECQQEGVISHQQEGLVSSRPVERQQGQPLPRGLSQQASRELPFPHQVNNGLQQVQEQARQACPAPACHGAIATTGLQQAPREQSFQHQAHNGPQQGQAQKGPQQEQQPAAPLRQVITSLRQQPQEQRPTASLQSAQQVQIKQEPE